MPLTPRFSFPAGPARRTLAVPNFRRYVVAQLASGIGMWNQRVAELWLLLELTGTGLSLGVGTALRTAPALFLAIPAGWLADRFDRRRLLTLTQASRGVVGAAFALVVATGDPSLALVYAMILALGVVNGLDGPMRRSYVRDVVTRDHLRAAAGLHTATISVGRLIGPLVAGVAIATAGIATAFSMSVVTSAIAIATVRAIRPLTERVPPHAEEPDAPSGEATPAEPLCVHLDEIMWLLGLFSILGWNIDVILPVFANSVLGQGPVAFSGLVICLSLGTFVGSLVASTLSRGNGRLRTMVRPLVLFSATLPVLASTDSLAAIALSTALAGAFGGAFLSHTNAAMQIAAEHSSQGRTVAMYSMVFTGSRAFGAPVLGLAIDRLGARPTLVLVGAFTGVAGLCAARILDRRSRARTGTGVAQPAA